MTDLPEWRKALNDSSHPMNRIAWDLFREQFNVQKVAERHADRRDAIIPFLYLIIDTEELQYESAPGGGFAPINAVKLLGEWQVVAAVPRLLSIIQEDEDGAFILTNDARLALENMPPEAIDILLEYVQKDPYTDTEDVLSILAIVGKGEDRVFDFICRTFEKIVREKGDVITAAEFIGVNNPKKATAYLEEQLKKGLFTEYQISYIRDFIKEVKAGHWDNFPS